MFGVQPAVIACDDNVLSALEGNAGLLISDLHVQWEMNPVALVLKETHDLGGAGIKSHW